jgi:chromosome partitioning protein
MAGRANQVRGFRLRRFASRTSDLSLSCYGTVASMLLIVSFVSQKGGVGKSTLARALAVVLRQGGMKAALADLDFQQSTIGEWAKLRDERGIKPSIPVRRFKTADDAIIAGGAADVLIIDGPARASTGTLELARQSDLVVQPSGCGLDDLRPAVLLFHELLAAGITRDRLVVALCRSAGEPEEGAARRYIEKAKYDVLAAALPERVTYRDAMNGGASFVETSDSNLNERAQALMDELLKKVRTEVAARGKRTRKEQAV